MSVTDDLIKLKKSGNNLEAEVVVEAARDAKNYPSLHAALQWDDEKAAHSWRLQQAHQLIIRCKITIEDGATQGMSLSRPVRQFVHLVEETGYRNVSEVISNDTLMARWVRQARAKLASLEAELANIAGLVSDRSEAEEVRQHTEGIDRWLDRRTAASQPEAPAKAVAN